jgi:DNA-binding CsgD family transcriptional regulator
LFAATREGLVLLDREAILHGDRHVVRRVFTERDGLPDGNVRSIDPEGDALWIGTLFGLSEAFATAGDLRVERLFEPLTRRARRLSYGSLLRRRFAAPRSVSCREPPAEQRRLQHVESGEMIRPAEMHIDEMTAARDAFARQAWKDAYAGFRTSNEARAQLDAEDLERLAVCAYMVGKHADSADAWTRAHSEWLRLGDVRRAARSTFWLALDLFMRGEHAQARGWLARTQHLLEAAIGDCAEQGLLLVLFGRLRLSAEDIDGAQEAASRAIDLARRFDDSELQVFSRLILAQVVATRGDAAAAIALFDEIMVAVTVGDVSPVGIGTVYCAVIEGCHALLDLGRAREWTNALSQWCDAQPDLVAFRGICLVHRVELLRLGGAWSQATAEAKRACQWGTGAAFYQLGELHRLRGRFAEADIAYRQASECGYAPEPGLPLLRIAQGQRAAAQAAIRRALGEPETPHRRASVLAACVEIMLDGSDLQTARAAADELAAMATRCEARYLRALAMHASGSVLLAEGDAAAALKSLRQAWMDWQEIDAPWEAARVRVLLGMTCRALGDEETAHLEFDAARRVFERLGAAPDLARVNGLRAPSAVSSDRTLTSRERQILALIARGMTNRAIAAALTISDRTVDRHVSNILTKLDLPSRSAATAYAYERGLVQQRT